MTNLLTRFKIKTDEVAALKTKEIKQPNIGAVVDWIDYLLLAPDARKQIQSVKEWCSEQQR